jgi:hypothetical protein
VRFSARTPLVCLLVGCLGAAVACASNGSTGPTPTPSSTATLLLQQLAAKGLQQYYTGVYNLTATKPQGVAVVTVGRTPTAYRINVQRAGSTSILIHNARGTYSCHKEIRQPAKCLLVAKPGSPVPPLFDAGQEVWSSYLMELSQNTAAYLVTPAGSTPATPTLPAGACFAIAPVASPAPGSVTTGTYCLSPAGIPTKAAFASGTFTLTRIFRAPKPNELLPLAKPTPIPGLR